MTPSGVSRDHQLAFNILDCFEDARPVDVMDLGRMGVS